MTRTFAILVAVGLWGTSTQGVANDGGVQRSQPGLTFFVATNGNDAWSGRLSAPGTNDGPFATLERARNEIRKLKKSGGLPAGGVAVEIRGGVYELPATLKLDKQDSGEAGKPIVYRAFKGETPRILGGRIVTGWTPVADPAVLARLDPSARGHVLQADLKSQQITDYGEVRPGRTGSQSATSLELFFDEKPTTLARWPNEGFAKIKKVLGKIPKYGDNGHIVEGCMDGVFSYEGDHPRRWIGEPDVMLEGYWCWDWADQRLHVKSIDPDKHVITLDDKPQHAYGFREGQGFYAYNVLAELDIPGEWYLDRAKGTLYFWPPTDIAKGQPVVSTLPSLINLEGTSHVAMRGLLLEMCRGTAVVAAHVDNVQITACTIRNTGSFAISLSGRDSRVVGCDIYDNGDGGITLTGGNRKTLAPGNLAADDNHIHHYARVNRMYKGAISLNGVGNRATHNLIDNAPHAAIFFSGNDHRIEFNEIHSVCYESNDAGAIYAGRNWTWRGNVIQCNYLHDISGFEGRGALGVYLDDQMSGVEISGNLFVRICNCVNAVKAAASTCGRDCMFVNNIFVDCHPAVEVATRPATTFPTMKKTLGEVPYQNSLWRSRYPSLATILDDDPKSPKGNVIARNICVGGRWSSLASEAKRLVTFQDNLLNVDPHFVDAAAGNYQLKDDSPAFKLGFKRIPLEKIGLYPSDDRASWPVASTVRPAGKPPAKTK